MMRGMLVLVCCGGCALFGGGKPKYDYYVLVAESAPKSARPESTGGTLGVSQVSIPRYLDRESIVTRLDEYRVVYSKQERWAEQLDDAFERTLRQDLAAALARDGIAVPARTLAPTHDLQVDLLRFERRGTDRVELWARWTLRTSGEPARTEEVRLEVPIVNQATAVAASLSKAEIARQASVAAAAALSEAIARLANSIAADVRVADAELQRRPPTTAER